MKQLMGALACMLVISGCDSVSSERIQQWKSTQKGPGKLRDALKDSSLTPKLRAEAAAAMVDVGMSDDVDQVMASLPAAQRWEILKTLIPLHVALLNDPS